ncbi:hypothetical protein, partial [Enterobacter bugandensis]|uniref:hypothetical protein n=1 Tax=Enterobacter bugandensis TaxID=881260 RepID=UPI002FCDFB77|nr:hypothetical protein [Enterobacter bugandensis]
FNYGNDLMLSKTGFTHSDLLCWQSDYAGGSLNVNGTIMRDTYIMDYVAWQYFPEAYSGQGR